MSKNKKKSPTCAVILIGNELLSGRTPDANFNVIARRMKDLGIIMKECRVIADHKRTIIETINELREKYSYVFTTGGIGPTHDDITTACVAEAFGVPICRDSGTEKAFRDHYGDRVKEATFQMADFPEGARLIPNAISIAPGFVMGNVFVMAGIPRVMQAMLDSIVPMLERGEEIYTQSVDVFAAESEISLRFEEIQNEFMNVDLGSYPFKVGDRFGTSLVGQSTDKESLDKAFTKVRNLINELGVETR